MPQTSFLAQVAEQILAQNFGALSAEQKQQYTPTLVALLEERVGIELLPKLNDAQTEQFVDLAESEQTTPAEWHNFWSAAVPNFEDAMARIVGEVAAEARGVGKS